MQFGGLIKRMLLLRIEQYANRDNVICDIRIVRCTDTTQPIYDGQWSKGKPLCEEWYEQQ
jgi:hypothetical protein